LPQALATPSADAVLHPLISIGIPSTSCKDSITTGFTPNPCCSLTRHRTTISVMASRHHLLVAASHRHPPCGIAPQPAASGITPPSTSAPFCQPSPRMEFTNTAVTSWPQGFSRSDTNCWRWISRHQHYRRLSSAKRIF
jgi:hypothetical protein